MIIAILKPRPRVPPPAPKPGDIRVRHRFAWWPTTVEHDTIAGDNIERYVVWLEWYWEKQQYLDVSDTMWLEVYDWVTVSRES